jgi:phosphatidylserine decarboxylase
MYTTRLFKEEPFFTILLSCIFIILITLQYYLAAYIIGIIYVCLILFYREPVFKIPYYKIQSNELTSPAYGTVYKIIQDPNTKRITVSIFLSPFDIHTQYYPTHGHVVEQVYDCTGKFHLAYELNKSNHNEKVITIMKNLNYGKQERYIKITQIAGFLVRRISTIHRQQQLVHAGDYLGMIKFGSRVDLEFDDIYTVNVREGQYVYGPHTLIASY